MEIGLWAAFRDPMFLWFPVGATVVSMASFLVFALPLTLLAWREPAWAASWRIQPQRAEVERWFRPSVDRWVMNNLALTGVILLIWPVVRLVSDVHLGPLPPGWVIGLQVIGFAYLDDVLYYFLHRLMHHPTLYTHVHRIHHRVRTPMAISGHFMHPVEYVLTGLLALLGPMLVGAHVVTLYLWVIVRQWEAAEGHCGYHLPFSPLGWLPGSHAADFHDFHHAKFVGNYAGFFGWFDGLMGTWAKGYPEHMAWRRSR
jgi:4-alpha-methyl-delta7-sterol-4alpha-methyl oxidase